MSTAYKRTALTGGTAAALDGIDGDNLLGGDFAFVMTSAAVYFYELDYDSGAAESSPDIIAPDDNPGNKRWILQNVSGVNLAESANSFTIKGGSSSEKTLTVDETKSMSHKMDKASNLSDVASAATSFANIKQAATTDATGVVELATPTEGIAGESDTLVMTPADDAAALAVAKNPLARAQGVHMTYAAGGSSGIRVADNDNINFGTGDFTLVWRGSLPDWTPSVTNRLMYKYQNSDNRWSLSLTTAGIFYIFAKYGGADAIPAVATTPVNTFAAGSTHEIVGVITRETAVSDGSIQYYFDGLPWGSPITLTAGAPTTINNSGALEVMGGPDVPGARYASITHFAATYNRALTAAEVLDLYRYGIDFADKWGSQTAFHTSDFSAGTDGYTATRGTVAGNIDSIDGESDCLRFYSSADNGTHNVWKSLLSSYIGKYVNVSVMLYLPSGQTAVDGIGIKFCDVGTIYNTNISTNSWTTINVDGVVYDQFLYFFALSDGNSTFIGANSDADDRFYVKNVVVKEIGATLALEPPGIQPAPGQWLDSSSNKLHAMQPATGSSLTQPKNTFEVRWVNTWAGTHEAQYIGGVNQNVLPDDAYIESIIGEISGSAGQNLILGDGSDTDHFVASVAMVDGVVSFAIANRTHDGTNKKLVVDPDANFTGTITWLIKGIILD